MEEVALLQYQHISCNKDVHTRNITSVADLATSATICLTAL